MPTDRERVLLLAARQHGVVGRQQLIEVGIDRRAAWRLTKEATLVAECGYYRLAGHDLTAESRLWSSVISSGGVLSHQTAARRLGAEIKTRSIHVTVTFPSHPKAPPSVTVHRSRRLPDRHISTEPGGLPRTTAPRTFVDLAAASSGLTDNQLIACLDAWIANECLTLPWLSWFLEVEARELNGRTRALMLVGRVAGTAVESVAERDLARLLVRAGLEPFETQHRIRRSGTLVGRVDFAWPAEQVALELDGYRFHSGPGVFAADRQRGNEIEMAGWRLLRTTPIDVRRNPTRVVKAVKEVLDLQRSVHQADHPSR